MNAISMKVEIDPRLIISRYNDTQIFPPTSHFTKLLIEAQATTETNNLMKRKNIDEDVLQYYVNAKRDTWQNVRF